ncbi:MAG: hypothetical protein ABIJ97_04160 [Bacteroidota bacterium]
MIKKEEILSVTENYFEENKVFFVDLKISPSGKIALMIDRYEGMTINICTEISRVIRNHFGEKLDNYELMVSSPGLDQPFMVLDQYKKNIDKEVKVQLKSGDSHKGILLSVTNDEIIIKPSEKKEGKKKNKVETEEKTLKFEFIKSTKSVIKI